MPVVLAAIQVYFWIVVNSFYHELKEQDRLGERAAERTAILAASTAKVAPAPLKDGDKDALIEAEEGKRTPPPSSSKPPSPSAAGTGEAPPADAAPADAAAPAPAQ